MGRKMVKSAYEIETVYMCFNKTGILDGETISRHKGFGVILSFLGIFQLLHENLQLDIDI